MINDLYHISENGLYKNLNSFKNLAKAGSRSKVLAEQLGTSGQYLSTVLPAAHTELAVTA